MEYIYIFWYSLLIFYSTIFTSILFFRRFSPTNFKLEKCIFEVPNVTFLGYIILGHGLHMDLQSVCNIELAPSLQPQGYPEILGVLQLLSSIYEQLFHHGGPSYSPNPEES